MTDQPINIDDLIPTLGHLVVSAVSDASWSLAQLDAYVGDDYSNIGIHLWDGNRNEVDGADTSQDVFDEIITLLRSMKQRFTQTESGPWERILFTLHRSGKFDVTFMYDDNEHLYDDVDPVWKDAQ